MMKPLTILIASFVLLLAACGGDDNDASPTATTPAVASTSTSVPEPSSTPSPEPSPTATREPTATASPTPGVVAPPQGTETGDPQLDAIISAVLERDREALLELFTFTEAPCTTAQGLGGPPKCADAPGSPPEGTVVKAFPASSCEGHWTFEIEPIVDFLVEREPQLYGVIDLERSPIFPSEDYFPTEEFAFSWSIRPPLDA